MILLLFIQSCFAEYRVFELVIKNQETQSERIVVSTLDPLQYSGYFPIQKNEFVTYKNTWMCYGPTSQKAICPNPRLDQNRDSGSSSK